MGKKKEAVIECIEALGGDVPAGPTSLGTLIDALATAIEGYTPAAPDLSGYATKKYVDDAIAALSPSGSE